MVEAGMDVARLNYSHGTLEEHAETVRRVRDAAGRAGRPVAILQDLPGPKLRIGPLREDIVELTPGERLTFSADGEELEGDARRMSVSWPGLADALEPDAVLYLADGSVRLRVRDVRVGEREVEAEVEVGGAVASRQGLNIPGAVDVAAGACPRRTSSCCATASRSASTWSRCRSCQRPRTSKRCASTRACR